MSESRSIQLVKALIPREGGYSNNPLDRGGETNFGITIGVARAFGYTGSMQAMPYNTAMTIYIQRFWLTPHFDILYGIAPELAEKCFDVGVNRGPSTGIKFLQRALNVLNENGKDWPDLTVDGGLGKISCYALTEFIKRRGNEGRQVLLAMLRAQQCLGYMEIAESNATQETFEYGWAVRSLL